MERLLALFLIYFSLLFKYIGTKKYFPQRSRPDRSGIAVCGVGFLKRWQQQ